MTLTTAGFPPKDVSVQGATNVKITPVELTVADTEYSLPLEASLKQLRIRCREIADLRYAFIAGDTGDTMPYWSVYRGTCDNIQDISFTDKTLYIRGNKNSITVEVMELY